MKIFFLIENTVRKDRPGLRPEHGLCIHVEHGGAKYLVDVGMSDRFLHNAEASGMEIRDVDAVFLSHGHMDHAGGLRFFLEKNRKARVYLASTAPDPHYLDVSGAMKNIGLDGGLTDDFPGRFVFLDGDSLIDDGVFVIKDIPERHRVPDGNRLMHAEKHGSIVADDFGHEIMPVFIEGGRAFCFVGCSHHGILNMLDAAKSGFPGKKRLMLIGGMHLVHPVTKERCEDDDSVREIAQRLMDDASVEMVITGHCTGEGAFSVMKGVMGPKIEYGRTGDLFEF
ncbi:MAG: MBL fold metallo-hydrolase [Spirochaetes bacterium]|nr:MBL fold metallo-hydrolase [Spirochaetota bacterium]